jgi:hypothetical protein
MYGKHYKTHGFTIAHRSVDRFLPLETIFSGFWLLLAWPQGVLLYSLFESLVGRCLSHEAKPPTIHIHASLG